MEDRLPKSRKGKETLLSPSTHELSIHHLLQAGLRWSGQLP